VAALLLLLGAVLPAHKPSPEPLDQLRSEVGGLRREFASLAHENQELESQIFNPDRSEIYLVVDTQGNRLYLYQGTYLLREAVVSTGSGKVMDAPGGQRRWVFQSPRGVRRVVAKVKNPVWYKPDWAFLEEGLPVPPLDDPSRVERDRLGPYALDLGNQIKIHGTLEKDRLGTPVSHGCIRVGDEDLEVLYLTTPVGARVFFF
jgi:L,D-transpeptidase YbiS